MLILTPIIYYNMDSFRDIISDLLDSNVGRAILVFSSAVKCQVMRVESLMKKGGIQIEISELCESDASALSTILWQMKSYKPDCIIGMGGGHCMDIAKVLRVLYEDPSTTLRSLAMGTNNNDEEKSLKKAMIHRRGSLIKKLVCIPTTCGSGSEVTSTAVLRNDDGRQMIVSGVAFLPDISVVDSSFILTIPMFVASITGMRALLHGLESYISNSSNHYSSCMAIQSLRILFNNLTKAVIEKDISLLQDIHKAASISGVAISATDVGLGSILSRSISEVFTLPHGLIDSIVITQVLNFNINRSQRVKSLIANLSVDLGISNSQDSDSIKIQALLNRVGQIRKTLLLPDSLSSIHSSLYEFKSKGWFDPIGVKLSVFSDHLYKDSQVLINHTSGLFSRSDKETQVYVSEESALKAIPILSKKNVIDNLNSNTFNINLDRMVSRALSDGAIHTNPVSVAKEDLSTILKQTWG
ncbi:NAD dependent dehydrogenase of bacterial origin [Cryptosporidium sp. chipmunk genotype I]|uniref:NAD dependent dehydrogenase of bacterial origin n=1 Tax=Cryptosporidium sp. chipmunk genotype I TaxID=1280935 RepID=UPI00351A8C79|nr:NAD dependent dehydrogenase of bacterial origin [Cryptosporidium sp. chipmunk genotype I]